MSGPTRNRLLFTLRFLILGVCLAACFSGRYPPAYAQYAPSRNSEDTEQDDKISQIDEHLRNSDHTHEDDIRGIRDTIKDQQASINEMKNTDSRNQGIIETFGGLLTFMVGGSITIQLRKKA